MVFDGFFVIKTKPSIIGKSVNIPVAKLKSTGVIKESKGSCIRNPGLVSFQIINLENNRMLVKPDNKRI